MAKTFADKKPNGNGAKVQPQAGEVAVSRDPYMSQLLKFLGSPLEDDLIQADPDVYYNLRDDIQIATCLAMRKAAVTNRGVEVVCGAKEEDPQYEQAKLKCDFVKAVLANLEKQTAKSVFSQTLDSILDGYYVAELVWDVITKEDRINVEGLDTTNMWRISRIKQKDPRALKPHFDRFDNIDKFINRPKFSALSETEIQLNKVWYFAPEEVYGKPRSGARPAYKWVRFAVEAVKQALIYTTRFAGGVTMAKDSPAPGGISIEGDSSANALAQKLQQMSVGNAFVYPDGSEAQIVWPPTGGDQVFINVINLAYKQVAKAILVGGWMAVEGNTLQGGGYDMGSTSMNVLRDGITNDRQAIEDSFNENVITQLCDYNFSDDSPNPTVSLGATDEKDIAALAVIYEKLTNMGLILDSQVMLSELGQPADLVDEEATQEADDLQKQQEDAVIEAMNNPKPQEVDENGKPIPPKGVKQDPNKKVAMFRYDPNQPRDPGGEDGGQWTSEGGISDSKEKSKGTPNTDGTMGKEPWQMTLEEFRASEQETAYDINRNYQAGAGNRKVVEGAVSGEFYHVAPENYNGKDITPASERSDFKNKWEDEYNSDHPDFNRVSLFQTLAAAESFNTDYLDGKGKILKAKISPKKVRWNAEGFATVKRIPQTDIIGEDSHYLRVKQALARGEKVPDAVLKDYPKLKKKPALFSYNPNQPRDPGGEDGGQWTSGAASGGITVNGEPFVMDEYVSEEQKAFVIKNTAALKTTLVKEFPEAEIRLQRSDRSEAAYYYVDPKTAGEFDSFSFSIRNHINPNAPLEHDNAFLLSDEKYKDWGGLKADVMTYVSDETGLKPAGRSGRKWKSPMSGIAPGQKWEFEQNMGGASSGVVLRVTKSGTVVYRGAEGTYMVEPSWIKSAKRLDG